MDTEYLFNIIGKLYVDINNAQRIIEALQKSVNEKDQEITRLKKEIKIND